VLGAQASRGWLARLFASVGETLETLF